MKIMKRCYIISFFFLLVFSELSLSDCSDYFRGRKYYEVQERNLLFSYPGTAVAVGTCMASCSNDKNPEECAIVACGLTCIVVGFENCKNFFSEAYALQQYKKRLEEFYRGCTSSGGSSSSQSFRASTGYNIEVKNSCNKPIRLAIRYKDITDKW